MSRLVHRHSQRALRAAAWSAVPVVVLSLCPAAMAANAVWTGAISSDWNNKDNWSTGQVPGLADTVYLVTHDTAGNALPFVPTNMNVAAAQFDNVYFTGTTSLTVSGADLTLDRLGSRITRTTNYTSGSDLVTISSANGGTTGLQVGMAIQSGDGIASGATITQIIDGTTFRISSAATMTYTNRGKNLEAGANLTWNPNTRVNAAEMWPVASNRTVTVNGNISGPGGLANSYAESGGTLDLKGVNTYLGRSVYNNGTLRFNGVQSISPATTIGLAWGNVRFASQTGTGEFAYSVPNNFENDNNAGTIYTGAGGRVTFTGEIMERPTAGVRGLKFGRDGATGNSVAELKGNVNQDGPLSVDEPVLVRLHNALSQSYGGSTDITNTTNSSVLDGTLDLMGNSFDRKVSYNNKGGMAGAGGLVNSKLSTPSTASGVFANLGTSSGNFDFGGPGALLITGDIRVNSSTTVGPGYNKVGPGAAIISSTNFLDVTPANNNTNEVMNGSLVMDNTGANSIKMTGDSLQLGNGRLVILGNATNATTYTATTLSLNGTSDRGFAEIDVRNNGGGAAFNFTTITNASDNEPLNFQVNRGTSAAPATIGSTQAAGKLAPTITFNRNQWASATGTAIVGTDPNVTAVDAASFQGATTADDVEVTGSFTTTALTKARTLRFTQASDNTLTLNANLELNKSAAAGSGILVTEGTGAVTINGSSAIDIGVNTSLTIHHHGSDTLQIDSRVVGNSGAKLSKVGIGELVLNNATNNWGFSSTGSPAINIYEGTVSVPAMANTGANSPIGTNGQIVMGARNDVNFATGIVTQSPAKLKYTGTGHSTNRVIQLVGVSEIQADGSALLHFTNTGDVVSNVQNTGNWNDLILSGTGSGQFDGAIKLGHGNLVKRGSGTWTLASSASLTTYGKLQVEEGTLVHDGSTFFHTDVLVSGSGKLAGSGTYSGAVTITSTGSISPGSSAGRMSTGNLDLGGTLVAEILGSTAGSGYDQLAVAGTVTLGATSNLQLSADYLPDDGSAYVLISNDGSEAIVGSFATANGLAIVDAQFAASGYTWRLDYAGGDGNDLVAMVTVPEPGLLTMGAGLAGLVLRRRRSA